jgi:putative oxidoreductase
VHRRNGFDATKGGYEFNLALMAIATGLLVAGPGEVSIHQVVDRALAQQRLAVLAGRRRRRRAGMLRLLAALLR